MKKKVYIFTKYYLDSISWMWTDAFKSGGLFLFCCSVLFSFLVHTSGWREALNHLRLSPPTINDKHRLQFPTMTRLIDLKIEDWAVPADCSLQAADLPRLTHTILCISHTISQSHIKSLYSVFVHVCVFVCVCTGHLLFINLFILCHWCTKQFQEMSNKKSN